MERNLEELRLVQETLSNLVALTQELTNKLFRIETEIKLRSQRQQDSEEDCPSQKRVRRVGSGVWEE